MGARILSRPPEGCSHMMVCDLIDASSGWWKKELVEMLFTPHEANQVLRIPISRMGAKDRLVWDPDQHGIFSVQSAYRLAQRAQEGKSNHAETSHAREGKSWMWRILWRLPIKPKLNHFMWKCLHGWLATNVAVQKRGAVIDTICRRCGVAEESLEHLFFHCDSSVLI